MMKPQTDWTWHKITKTYRGGANEFQIATPKGVRLAKDDWSEILDYIAEHTSGGHGSENITTLYRKRIGKKSKTLRVVMYPSYLCGKLMKYGVDVTYTRSMIGA